MSRATIRSGVARGVFITLLAVSLLFGAFALGQPREASARPSIYNAYCMVGDYYMQLSQEAYRQGNAPLSAHYLEVAVGYLQHC